MSVSQQKLSKSTKKANARMFKDSIKMQNKMYESLSSPTTSRLQNDTNQEDQSVNRTQEKQKQPILIKEMLQFDTKANTVISHDNAISVNPPQIKLNVIKSEQPPKQDSLEKYLKLQSQFIQAIKTYRSNATSEYQKLSMSVFKPLRDELKYLNEEFERVKSENEQLMFENNVHKLKQQSWKNEIFDLKLTVQRLTAQTQHSKQNEQTLLKKFEEYEHILNSLRQRLTILSIISEANFNDINPKHNLLIGHLELYQSEYFHDFTLHSDMSNYHLLKEFIFKQSDQIRNLKKQNSSLLKKIDKISHRAYSAPKNQVRIPKRSKTKEKFLSDDEAVENKQRALQMHDKKIKKYDELIKKLTQQLQISLDINRKEQNIMKQSQDFLMHFHENEALSKENEILREKLNELGGHFTQKQNQLRKVLQDLQLKYNQIAEKIEKNRPISQIGVNTFEDYSKVDQTISKLQKKIEYLEAINLKAKEEHAKRNRQIQQENDILNEHLERISKQMLQIQQAIQKEKNNNKRSYFQKEMIIKSDDSSLRLNLDSNPNSINNQDEESKSDVKIDSNQAYLAPPKDKNEGKAFKFKQTFIKNLNFQPKKQQKILPIQANYIVSDQPSFEIQGQPQNDHSNKSIINQHGQSLFKYSLSNVTQRKDDRLAESIQVQSPLKHTESKMITYPAPEIHEIQPALPAETPHMINARFVGNSIQQSYDDELTSSVPFLTEDISSLKSLSDQQIKNLFAKK